MTIDQIREALRTQWPKDVAEVTGLPRLKLRHMAESYGWPTRQRTINRVCEQNPDASNAEIVAMLAAEGIETRAELIRRKRRRAKRGSRGVS